MRSKPVFKSKFYFYFYSLFQTFIAVSSSSLLILLPRRNTCSELEHFSMHRINKIKKLCTENYLKSMHIVIEKICADKREKPDRNLITKPHKKLPWKCPKYGVSFSLYKPFFASTNIDFLYFFNKILKYLNLHTRISNDEFQQLASHRKGFKEPTIT